MMTAEYSENAKRRIEDYLNAVRDRLKASESVDAQEVVDDLRGHIERELSGAVRSVSEADVKKVLDRLGPPEQVVDEGDMSGWRKVILRLRRGPEDWRLAYLSLGLLVLGTMLLTVSPWLYCVLALASFLVSRAALAATCNRIKPFEKWLIYPGLLLAYLAFAGILLAVVPITAGAVAFDFAEQTPIGDLHLAEAGRHLYIKAKCSDVLCAYLAGSVGLAAAGLCWALLSVLLLFGRFRAAASAVFRPFLDRLSRKTVLIALCIAVTLFLLGAAAIAGGIWHIMSLARALRSQPMSASWVSAPVYGDSALPQSQPTSIAVSTGYAQQMRQASVSKFQRIGELLAAYATDHDAAYPTLSARAQELAGYRRPSDLKEGSVVQYLLLNIEYLAGGRTRTGSPHAVVAYDRTLLQFVDGTNVLFEDGHVEFVGPDRFAQLGVKPQPKARMISGSRDYPVDLPDAWKSYVSAGTLTVVGSPFYGVRCQKWFAGWPHVQIQWSLKNLTDKPLELRFQYKGGRVTGGGQTGHALWYRLAPHENLAVDDLIPVMSAVVPEVLRVMPMELRHSGGEVTLADPHALVTTDPIPPQARQQMVVHTKNEQTARLVLQKARLAKSQTDGNLLELTVVNRAKTTLPLVVFAAAGDTARTDTVDRTNFVETSRFFEARQQIGPDSQCVVRLPFSVPNSGPKPLLVFTLFAPVGNAAAADRPLQQEDMTPVCWGSFDLKEAANQSLVILPAYEPIEERVKLTSQTRSEHFVFRYRPRSYAHEHIQAAVQARERAYQELKNVLRMELPKRVTIDLYNDMEAKGVGSGTYYTPANTVSDTQIAEVYNEDYQCDPHHELAHLFAYSIPGRGKLPDNWCLSEAFAGRFETGTRQSLGLARATLKQQLAAGKLKPLDQILLRQADTKQVRENPDLQACIVFLEFAAGRDIEQFKKFYVATATDASTPQDLEAICQRVLNMSLKQLERQWQSYLAEPRGSVEPPTSAPASRVER